jgi:hypothetical protein
MKTFKLFYRCYTANQEKIEHSVLSFSERTIEEAKEEARSKWREHPQPKLLKEIELVEIQKGDKWVTVFEYGNCPKGSIIAIPRPVRKKFE